jgi:hypothetical protein
MERARLSDVQVQNRWTAYAASPWSPVTREILDPRLGHGHAIERVAMVKREVPDLLHVLQRRRQKGKAGSLNRGAQRHRHRPKEVLIATSQAAREAE